MLQMVRGRRFLLCLRARRSVKCAESRSEDERVGAMVEVEAGRGGEVTHHAGVGGKKDEVPGESGHEERVGFGRWRPRSWIS